MVAAERYFRSVKLNFLGSESALLENIEGGFERAAQFQGAEKGRQISWHRIECGGFCGHEILECGSVQMNLHLRAVSLRLRFENENQNAAGFIS
jgi:hypothetical protein